MLKRVTLFGQRFSKARYGGPVTVHYDTSPGPDPYRQQLLVQIRRLT